jgi:hypothetical protein
MYLELLVIQHPNKAFQNTDGNENVTKNKRIVQYDESMARKERLF